jgi:hypothetical protein
MVAMTLESPPAAPVARRCEYCGSRIYNQAKDDTNHCSSQRCIAQAAYAAVYEKHGLIWAEKRKALGLPAEHLLGVKWRRYSGEVWVLRHDAEGRLVWCLPGRESG